MVVLCAIAVGVLIKQRFQHPAVKVLFSTPSAIDQPEVETSGIETYVPDAFGVMSPPEVFEEGTLSDKINGKAELYLSTGFRKMTAQRFVSKSDASLWFEVYVYDMGSGENALSVYSVQRRPEAAPLEGVQKAYATANGIFLYAGPLYVELVGSAAEPALMDAMRDWAQAYIADHAQEASTEQGLDLISILPEQGMVPDSLALHKSDVFGFEQLDRVVVAEYEVDGQRLFAFATLRDSAEEADALAEAYIEFLETNTGKPVDLGLSLPDAVFMEIFGVYEMVFTSGRLMAGIHEAFELEALKKLAPRLYEELQAVEGL